MNCLSWGPPGWRYLHTVAQNYDPNAKRHYRSFFTVMKDILPCKWCRMSYTEYIGEIPLTGYLGTRHDLSYWLYQIHNKVNDKLRGQGLLHRKDPSFASVLQKYDKISLSDSKPMWDFLNTIIHNYDPAIHDPKIYTTFFRDVGHTIPYPAVKPLYQEYLQRYPIHNNLSSQLQLTRWFYGLRQWVTENMRQQGYNIPALPSYAAVYKKFEGFRANCNNKAQQNNKTVTLSTCRIPDRQDRCKATTQKGRQCVRKIIQGRQYCPIHNV